MLINYFKIAIAVLKRRKFFTFISLFGISFTVAILLVLASLLDATLNSHYPDKKRNRSLYVKGLAEKGPQSFNGGNLSRYLIDHYITTLQVPEKIAISSSINTAFTYINNRKINMSYKYTNDQFWEVLDHVFIEGKPYTLSQIHAGERVAVITASIKNDYFGNSTAVVGKYIKVDNVDYRVTGVVKDVPAVSDLLAGDVYLPWSLAKDGRDYKGYRGAYSAILLARTAGEVPAMQKEFANMIARLPLSNPEYTEIICKAQPYLIAFLDTGREEVNGPVLFLSALILFALIIMLFPAINMVNINITRIMERSSEIGVRKAFGASSRTLTYQFIVENLILTFLGGLAGIVLSALILYYVNSTGWLTHITLTVNITVLITAVFVCLVFGLLSGVYPAWRMSKMPVVNALKA